MCLEQRVDYSRSQILCRKLQHRKKRSLVLAHDFATVDEKPASSLMKD